MGERTVACPICGEPYKVFAMTVADQSACPDCVAKADAKLGRQPPQLPDGLPWKRKPGRP